MISFGEGTGKGGGGIWGKKKKIIISQNGPRHILVLDFLKSDRFFEVLKGILEIDEISDILKVATSLQLSTRTNAQ